MEIQDAAQILLEFYILRHTPICTYIQSKRQRAFAVMILRDVLSGEKKEVEIRNKYGNSPDVSKALRHLLSLKYIERIGKGGRSSPFIYQKLI